MMTSKYYVIWSTRFQGYLHATNFEVSIITWCQSRGSSLIFKAADVGRIHDRLKSWPKYEEFGIKILAWLDEV